MAPGSSSTVCPKARLPARLWARRLAPMAMTCWPPCSPRRSGSGCAGCPRSRGCGSSGSSNSITTRAGCAGVAQPPVNQRLHSPYDPDARYAKKRDTSWIGYKVHLTETCEADRPNLITDVQTTAAGTPDGAVTAPVQSALAGRGLLPETSDEGTYSRAVTRVDLWSKAEGGFAHGWRPRRGRIRRRQRCEGRWSCGPDRRGCRRRAVAS